MTALPPTWTSTSLDVVGVVKTGNTPSTKNPEFYGGEIPFVKPSDLDKQVRIKTTDQYLTVEGAAQSRLLRPGAVLVSCIGNLGKTGIAGVPLATNQQINSVEFHSSVVDDRYGYYVCKTLKPWMEKEASATTISILNKGRFSTAPFPLAPFSEQKRIADKLDTVLARVDACRERLNRVPLILKRFRQSVLAAATSGKLTEDWRSVRSPDHGQRNPLNPDANASASILPVLPESWHWSCPENIRTSERHSLAIGPFGSNLKVSDYKSEGIPLVFVREVRARSFGGPETKFVTHQKAAELSAHSISAGDLLITKMGDPPGDTAIYPKNAPNAVITADCIKLRVNTEVALSSFVQTVLESPQSRLRLQEITAGVAQQKISLQRFRHFPIPLASIEEQHEIVRRVETLFAFANSLEARLASACNATDRLTPALLAKAFRGELVPQDPNDEPAAELLKRLAAAREPVAKGKRSSKSAGKVKAEA